MNAPRARRRHRRGRGQDLVAGLQRERAQHRVDAAARVVDERQAVAVGAEKRARPGRQRARRRGASGGRRHAEVHQLADHEARRMALDLVEDRAARPHDRDRRDADGAVVQVDRARLRAGSARASRGQSAGPDQQGWPTGAPPHCGVARAATGVHRPPQRRPVGGPVGPTSAFARSIAPQAQAGVEQEHLAGRLRGEAPRNQAASATSSGVTTASSAARAR